MDRRTKSNLPPGASRSQALSPTRCAAASDTTMGCFQRQNTFDLYEPIMPTYTYRLISISFHINMVMNLWSFILCLKSTSVWLLSLCLLVNFELVVSLFSPGFTSWVSEMPPSSDRWFSSFPDIQSDDETTVLRESYNSYKISKRLWIWWGIPLKNWH